MSDDLYTQWLKIPPGERPPDHYAMLGLPRFCDDMGLIEGAATRQMDSLDRYSLNSDPSKRNTCQQMMNEVAQARTVLVNPQRRAEYDLTLPASPWPSKRERPSPRSNSGPFVLHRRRPFVAKLLVGLAAAVVMATAVIWGLSPDADQRHRANIDRELAAGDFAGARADAAAIKDRTLAKQLMVRIGTAEAVPRVRLMVERAMQDAEANRVEAAATAFVNACVLARQKNVRLASDQQERLTTFLIAQRLPPEMKYPWGSTPMTGPDELRARFLDHAALQRTRSEQRQRCLAAAVAIVADPSSLYRQVGEEQTAMYRREVAMAVARQADAVAKVAERRSLAASHAPYVVTGVNSFSFPIMVPDANPLVGSAWESAIGHFAAAVQLFVDEQFEDAIGEWNVCCTRYARAESIGAEAQVRWAEAAYEWSLANQNLDPNKRAKAAIAAKDAQDAEAAAGFDADALEAVAASYHKAESLLENIVPPPTEELTAQKPTDESLDTAPRRISEVENNVAAPPLIGRPVAVMKAVSGVSEHPPAHKGGNARFIVFLCNKSTHMNRHLGTLKDELNKGIVGLTPIQSFNIIFSGENRPDKFGEGLLAATPGNKRKAGDFLSGIDASENGDAIAGLEAAFRTHPQLLFLIADWDFDDNEAVAAKVRALNKDKRVKVSTIGFDSKRNEGHGYLDVLKRIAKENGGTFKMIDDE